MSLLNRSASGTLVSLSACIANEARDRAKRLHTQMSVYCLEVRREELSIRVANDHKCQLRRTCFHLLTTLTQV
ncbi:hypothetical protein QCA50_013490 [Cerrena zonata]|uniref:Secreted protein n=1 Tax=Cerrena zonata TaxID=2478898 RepID=A0AAW0FNG0_9APHY